MILTPLDMIVIYIIWLFLAIIIRDIFWWDREEYVGWWALIMCIVLCFLLPVSTFIPEESKILSTIIGRYLFHLIKCLLGGTLLSFPLLFVPRYR